MKKSIVKKLESLPTVYDRNGEPIKKVTLANKIIDIIPHADRLNLIPFEVWVPLPCSGCYYNSGKDTGCSFGLIGEREEQYPPVDCPLGYG